MPVPSTDALRQQVQALLEQEDWPKALALIEEARKLEAGNQALLAEEEAAAALGLAKREMGRDPQKARALLLQATQGKPGWAEAWFQLGRVDTLLERYDEALSAYGQALAADPQLAGAHFNQGYILLKLGRTQQALQAYGRVAEIGGDLQADAYLNLGVCHARLGQLDKAAAMFEQVLSRRPGDAQAQRYLQQVRPAAGSGQAGQPRQ